MSEGNIDKLIDLVKSLKAQDYAELIEILIEKQNLSEGQIDKIIDLAESLKDKDYGSYSKLIKAISKCKKLFKGQIDKIIDLAKSLEDKDFVDLIEILIKEQNLSPDNIENICKFMTDSKKKFINKDRTLVIGFLYRDIPDPNSQDCRNVGDKLINLARAFSYFLPVGTVSINEQLFHIYCRKVSSFIEKNELKGEQLYEIYSLINRMENKQYIYQLVDMVGSSEILRLAKDLDCKKYTGLIGIMIGQLDLYLGFIKDICEFMMDPKKKFIDDDRREIISSLYRKYHYDKSNSSNSSNSFNTGDSLVNLACAFCYFLPVGKDIFDGFPDEVSLLIEKGKLHGNQLYKIYSFVSKSKEKCYITELVTKVGSSKILPLVQNLYVKKYTGLVKVMIKLLDLPLKSIKNICKIMIDPNKGFKKDDRLEIINLLYKKCRNNGSNIGNSLVNLACAFYYFLPCDPVNVYNEIFDDFSKEALLFIQEGKSNEDQRNEIFNLLDRLKNKRNVSEPVKKNIEVISKHQKLSEGKNQSQNNDQNKLGLKISLPPNAQESLLGKIEPLQKEIQESKTEVPLQGNIKDIHAEQKTHQNK